MNSLNRSPTSINYFDFLNYPSGWLPLQSPPRCYRTHNQLGLPPPSPTSCSPQEGSHSPGGFILTDEQQRRPGPTKISILLIQECLVLTFLVGFGYWKRLAFTPYPQNVEIPFPFSQRWLFLREDFCRNISSFCTESHLLWGVDKKWHWLKINGGLSRWRRLLWEKKSVCSAPCGAST